MEKQAIDFSYLYTGVEPTEYLDDGIAIVTIHGPLEHHATPEWDSYESILNRVEAAMSGEELCLIDEMAFGSEDDFTPRQPEKARAVILRIDSPGGEAAGAADANRAIRRLRKKYNVPLYAFANEMIASAAYQLACAADELWLPDTGQVGSIGVVATMFDRTKHNDRTGVHIELLTSGEQKADNHADRPLTDEIRARMMLRVNALADVFFAVVSKGRGMSPKAVKRLQAGIFTGQDAVDVGIADGVATWADFLRTVRSGLDALEGFDA